MNILTCSFNIFFNKGKNAVGMGLFANNPCYEKNIFYYLFCLDLCNIQL